MTEGMEGQGQQGQAPAPRNRHSQGDGAPLLLLLRRCSTEAPREAPSKAEPPGAAEPGDSEEPEKEEKEKAQERTSYLAPPPPPAPGAAERALGPGARGQPVAPDGGWGWMVLVATMLVTAMTLAFPTCLGIFFTELQAEFNASNTETSWVPAIMTAVLNAGGPLCSVLVERFGCRVTVMVGGVLSGLGMAVSALARTITDLYITGIVTGLGFCLSFQPSVTMMGHYFVRRRAFANALSSTGTALGLSALPLIANYLLAEFGWRGSFLVLGGLLLNCCVCGAVMRPLAPPPPPGPDDKPWRPQAPVTKPDGLPEKEGPKARLRTSLYDLAAFLRRHMAFDLLVNNSRYRAYAVGVTWMMLGFVVPFVYLVPYATDHGMEQDRAALLMAILGLVNVTVRPVAALVFGLPRFRGSGCFVYVFGAAVLANGLSNSICGASASFDVLLAYAVVFGASMSVVGTLLFTVLMETVEMSRFPAALGLVSMLESVTLLIGPPLAGMLADRTHQYSYVFYACSVTGSLAGLFLLGSFYLLDRQSDREKRRKEKKPSGFYQKPSVILASDCEYSQVPDVQQGGTATDTVYVTNV